MRERERERERERVCVCLRSGVHMYVMFVVGRVVAVPFCCRTDIANPEDFGLHTRNPKP